MIRFHLDEHGSHALAEGLRRLGLEVTMTFEVGLLHASDEKQLEFARAHERVIFTNDDDSCACMRPGCHTPALLIAIRMLAA